MRYLWVSALTLAALSRAADRLADARSTGTIEDVYPEVVAHRGASAHRAEHTRAAYELAIADGADGLECDVRLTRDGHLVCVHDRLLDRTSNGTGPVSARTLADLAELDFAGWSGAEPEIGVLSLDALLALVVDHDRPVRLFVETKHPIRYGGQVERELVRLLARYGKASPVSLEAAEVVVMSFSSAAMRRVKRLAPAVPTVLLTAGPPRKLPPWADILGPGIRKLRADPGFVERAAARGRPTYCWTVNEPEDVLLCAELGVRYLATDSPSATRSLLARPGSTTVAKPK
ncbi:glycerophosphoryl diester phosphodiesterase [Allokutzneria albata]|uniref:Glycerophosphoryl diester phosphodiesterase n=1 Tax=Allokutzneria albata TaxID=211114 RepID=A0A1H0A476_ALLAB|nr:glycerophosphoryl diester phosphodiesterase [Allokutzneria albata]